MRHEREKQEAVRSQKKEWNLEGTKLGNIMGVKEKKEDVKEVATGQLRFCL